MNRENKSDQHLSRGLQEVRSELAALGRTVVELTQSWQCVAEQLRLQELASELYSEFLDVPGEEVDRKIEYGLKRLVELLGHDRTSLRQYVQEKSQLLVTHWWTAKGVKLPPRALANDDVPYLIQRLRSGRVFAFSTIKDLPDEALVDRRWFETLGQKSALAIPLRAGHAFIGGLTFGSFAGERDWSLPIIRRLELIGKIFANAIAQRELADGAHKSVRQSQIPKNGQEHERVGNPHPPCPRNHRTDIVGHSDRITSILRLAEQVAPTDAPVLIMGETGTGKELLARTIHAMSSRRNRPMLTVNCSALPASLIEGELFGHEKGAYTGACSREVGRFEMANGSTLFLDEIGDLALESQPRLLRAIEDGTFERLGSSRTMRVDVRIIAATNKDLAEEMRAGRFRKDLYFRLNVFPMIVSRLCDRREDIPELVWAFVHEFGEKLGKTVDHVPAYVMKGLQNHSWPGNVRELKNVVEQAMITSTQSTLTVAVPDDVRSHEREAVTLEEIERNHIVKVLASTGGRVKGRGGAAHILGMNASTLFSRMRKLGVKPPQ